MITVYVIESLVDQIWYTGMAKNASDRLREHNSGKNRFTKGHRAWKLIYTEQHADWKVARQREIYLKSAVNDFSRSGHGLQTNLISHLVSSRTRSGISVVTF
jgi:putative endonuclease